MTTRTRIAAGLLAGALLMACSAGAQTLEEVQQELNAAFAKVNSLTADLAMSMTMGPGMSMTGNGAMALLREGEVVKYVQDMTMSIQGPMSMETRTTTLFDGQAAYVTTDAMGQRQVHKSQAGADDGFPPPGGELLWEMLGESFELTLGEPAEVDGHACHVIVAKPKEEEVGFAEMRLHFDKALGISRKMEGRGDVQTTLTYSNVVLNPEIDPAKFVYVAEEGVEVMDMDAMMQPPAEEAAETPEEAPEAP